MLKQTLITLSLVCLASCSKNTESNPYENVDVDGGDKDTHTLTDSTGKTDSEPDGGQISSTDSSVDPPTSEITFQIDPSEETHEISPYIYGINESPSGDNEDLHPFTLRRSAGFRWTTYNWENNATYGGVADNFETGQVFGGDSMPAEAVRSRILEAKEQNVAQVITLPLSTYVASSDQTAINWEAPDPLSQFTISRPYGPWNLFDEPGTSDQFTYQNELVYRLKEEFISDGEDDPPLMWSLDDEPDLWSDRFPELHPLKPSYDEIVQRTVEYSSAIKVANASSTVFGFCGSGWEAMSNLGDASDTTEDGNFLDTFLAYLSSGEVAHGHRLVDVVDIHWASSAESDGESVLGGGESPELIVARVQAPRSLWDETYVEDSSITRGTNAPIALLPLLKAKIDALYPLTEIAVGSYDFGGHNHISGAIAITDTLGIFGKQDIFAAAASSEALYAPYTLSAFNAYLDYDGQGSHFGEASLTASTNNREATSIYASRRTNDNALVLVALNKTDSPLTTKFDLNGLATNRMVKIYSLTSNSSDIVASDSFEISNDMFELELPDYSITILELFI